MKLTPVVRVRWVIADPDDEAGSSIITGMHPDQMSSASLRTDNDGYVYVSWLEIIPGWKAELYGFSKAVVRGGLILMSILYFWTFGVVVFQSFGVI
ncbi:hypothetical protein [Methanolobus sp. ZRKC5]|uniref:hypothetical protein n=1 Tax=unclassified Methanolobus TaxID=2629569 RepID=UPI00313CC37C